MKTELHKHGSGFLVAVVLSAAYTCVIAWSFFLTSKPIWQLDLNEMGDALAGAFAPLAFLWLVLGFFQQGRELKQNTQQLKESVQQFTTQSASLKETNTLERRKLAITEWDRTHQEMSSILSQYLYMYFAAQKRKNMSEVDIAQSIANPDYRPKGIVDPTEFVDGRWSRYSLGDKNTFFRTVYYQTRSSKPEVMKTLGPKTQVGSRYLALHKRLLFLMDSEENLNTLLITDEMTGIAKFISGEM